MDSPLKCFNQALSSRLSLQCSSNELLGYLLAILYYSDFHIYSPIHITVARSQLLNWVDKNTSLHEVNYNDWYKLRMLVLDIFTRLQHSGFNWLYT